MCILWSQCKSKSELFYQIDPYCCHGLSEVVGKYGKGERRQWPLFVAISPKGSMGQSLFHLFIEYVVLPQYPNIQKETIQDKDGCKIKGPIIILRLVQDQGACVAMEILLQNTWS